MGVTITVSFVSGTISFNHPRTEGLLLFFAPPVFNPPLPLPPYICSGQNPVSVEPLGFTSTNVTSSALLS